MRSENKFPLTALKF